MCICRVALSLKVLGPLVLKMSQLKLFKQTCNVMDLELSLKSEKMNIL